MPVYIGCCVQNRSKDIAPMNILKSKSKAGRPIAAILFFCLCACTMASESSIKRMEGFDEEMFHKRYLNKEPVIITKLKKEIKKATTEVFQHCSKNLHYLTRLPSMQEDLEDISLTEAFRPCGADCYGIHETKVCDEALDNGLEELPEAFVSEEGLWYSIAHEGIETPASITEGHYFRYLSSGVEDWRLLTRFEDGIIDLFTQKPYADKLVAGDLLYVPPNTLTPHSALTPLTVALGHS